MKQIPSDLIKQSKKNLALNIISMSKKIRFLEEIIKTCEKCTEKNILKGLGLP
jgi:hypothetical protein